MQTLNRHALCFFLGLACVGTAAAQTSEEEELALSYGDKSNISIATGSPQPISKAPSTATVITAEDIKTMGATDLDQVMETVPGVHVAHSAVANAPIYIIRGVYSTNNPQTLMLLNGVPTTTMFTGSKGNVWGGFPLESIARIEIIRGPGSALYGADAYAGVINIITKTATDTPGTEFGARASSFNTKDAWVQHGGKLGTVDVAAYLRVGSTDGFKQTVTQTATGKIAGISTPPGPVNTGYDAIDGSVNFGYDKWRLSGGYKLRDNVGTGAGVASALDPVGKTRSERITADLSWIDPNVSQDLGVGLVASYLQYNDTVVTPFVLYPPGVNFGKGAFPNGVIGAPEKWERDFRFSPFATYSGFKNHQLRVGMGHDDLNLYKTEDHANFTLSPAPTPLGSVIDVSNNANATFMFPHRRTVNYFYAQDEWNYVKDWTLTAGVRHDQFSDFGGTTNPRLALVWDASYDLTAKLLYGQAFRAPAFVEEYSINNPVQQGNPNLRAETNRTLEEAFSWQARKDTQINLNFFHYEMNNIIRLVPNVAPAVGATYQNTGKQHGNGMELEAVWDASRSVRLTGNYSYQKSIDETTNQDAGYAPHNHIYLRGDWRFAGGWLTSTQIDRVADRMRAPGDTRPPVPDYTTVDMTARTTRDKIEYAASVRNLFNATVLEPSLAPGTAIPYDLPQAPRSVWLQLSYKL
jgi:iron complex outermembrane receptor protein